MTLTNSGKPTDSLKTLERALAIRQSLADAHPNVDRYRSDLGNSHNQVGFALSVTGKPTEASRRSADLGVPSQAGGRQPGVTQFQSDLAKCYNNIGAMLSAHRQVA